MHFTTSTWRQRRRASAKSSLRVGRLIHVETYRTIIGLQPNNTMRKVHKQARPLDNVNVMNQSADNSQQSQTYVRLHYQLQSNTTDRQWRDYHNFLALVVFDEGKCERHFADSLARVLSSGPVTTRKCLLVTVISALGPEKRASEPRERNFHFSFRNALLLGLTVETSEHHEMFTEDPTSPTD